MPIEMMNKDETIEEIKKSLVEEEAIQNRIKKEPGLYEDLGKRLHVLYRARMLKERELWGCSVNRDLFSILKNTLLEQQHLEQLLNDGHKNEKIESLLRIAQNRGDIYVEEIEKNINPNVSCPLLPQGESISSISAHIRNKSQSIIDNQKNKGGKKEKKSKSDIKRRELIRMFMSST